MTTDYRLIEGDTASALAGAVSSFLRANNEPDGNGVWTPHGSHVVTTYTYNDAREGETVRVFVYSQALVLMSQDKP